MSRRWWVAAAALPLAFLGYFFAYPLLTILWTGLTPDGSLDLAPFVDIAAKPSLRRVAWFTLWQAVASTILTLIIALPITYVLTKYRFRGRSVAKALITVPFVLPTVVVGAAVTALLGPRSPVTLTGTVWAILIAHVFFNLAVVVRTVGGLWERLDPTITDAARVLGANRWRVFRSVTLPLLRPAIMASAVIVFLFSFTSFGVVLILGDLRHTTLEVEIWRQTTALLDLPVAAALAIVQLIGIGGVLWWYSRLQGSRELRLRASQETGIAITSGRDRLIVFGALAATATVLGGPLLVLIRRSLTGEFGLDYYAALSSTRAGSFAFVPPTTAIWNSAWIALVAAAIALVIGGLAAVVVAYRSTRAARLFDALLMLPLGTSAVTVGFGFLIALDAPIDLRTSIALVPIAHAVVAVPFVVRTAVPVMRSVRHRLREAAAVLGASPRRAWREIDLPIIARSLGVGAGFAVAVSLGEFGATAFVARPGAPTIPVLIFRLLGLPGSLNTGQAMALSTILMIVITAAILSVERLRIGTIGEF